MNNKVIENFNKFNGSLLYLPTFLLLGIFAFLCSRNAFSNEGYSQIQKKLFLSLNSELSAYPQTMNNLTQCGDALVILSFLTLFIVYAPKLWEALITSSIISAIIVAILKPLFAIKRPAAAFSDEHFSIIGRKLLGSNSFPSGHSVTVFAVMTVILIAFLPKRFLNQVFWCILIFGLAILFASTRIAVGAHYPLDVTVGAIVGYISAILGIVINKKYKIWEWLCCKKFYPFFIIVFFVCSFIVLFKIYKLNLLVFYLSLSSLLISLFVIIKKYVKK